VRGRSLSDLISTYSRWLGRPQSHCQRTAVPCLRFVRGRSSYARWAAPKFWKTTMLLGATSPTFEHQPKPNLSSEQLTFRSPVTRIYIEREPPCFSEFCRSVCNHDATLLSKHWWRAALSYRVTPMYLPSLIFLCPRLWLVMVQ